MNSTVEATTGNDRREGGRARADEADAKRDAPLFGEPLGPDPERVRLGTRRPHLGHAGDQIEHQPGDAPPQHDFAALVAHLRVVDGDVRQHEDQRQPDADPGERA